MKAKSLILTTYDGDIRVGDCVRRLGHHWIVKEKQALRSGIEWRYLLERKEAQKEKAVDLAGQ